MIGNILFIVEGLVALLRIQLAIFLLPALFSAVRYLVISYVRPNIRTTERIIIL